jgi:hypothetical protein
MSNSSPSRIGLVLSVKSIVTLRFPYFYRKDSILPTRNRAWSSTVTARY